MLVINGFNLTDKVNVFLDAKTGTPFEFVYAALLATTVIVPNSDPAVITLVAELYVPQPTGENVTENVTGGALTSVLSDVTAVDKFKESVVPPTNVGGTLLETDSQGCMAYSNVLTFAAVPRRVFAITIN